jgi:RNA polymerase sigma factor (sigma-70 family)
LLRVASDAHLVALVREGKAAAFEAIYDRHHRAILSFCRHMLGSMEEAEDAVQHTFLAAYNDLVSSRKAIQLRPWLFTIARNRCYSTLRARREQPLGELDEPTTEGLATQVQRREDLRDLVGDLRRLPNDQRAALVLSEMDALSHEQIAGVLGVPKDKVKALVFQARESLVASRAARETDCTEIRAQLANLHGGALRRANLRRHLRECAGCRDFRVEVERQRRQLRIVLPVAPTLALKEAVLAATVGGGTSATIAAGGGGGALAGSLLKGGVLKSLVGAAIDGVGTAGTIVAVHDFQSSVGESVSGRHHLTPFAPFTPAPAVDDAATKARASASAPSTAAYASRYSPVQADTAVASGHGSPYSQTGSGTTPIAILRPLSRHALSVTAASNPLQPTTPSQLSAPVDPWRGGHGWSRLRADAPNLSPAAFGQGNQDGGGGYRTYTAGGGNSQGGGGGFQGGDQSASWPGGSSPSPASSGPGWRSHAVSGSGGSGAGSDWGSHGSSNAGNAGSSHSTSGAPGWGSGSGHGGGDQGGSRGGQGPGGQGSGGQGWGGGQGSGAGSAPSSSAGASGQSSWGGGQGAGQGAGGQGSSGAQDSGPGQGAWGGQGGDGQGGDGQGGGGQGNSGYGGGSDTAPHGR